MYMDRHVKSNVDTILFVIDDIHLHLFIVRVEIRLNEHFKLSRQPKKALDKN